jgi:hypothetical protein
MYSLPATTSFNSLLRSCRWVVTEAELCIISDHPQEIKKKKIYESSCMYYAPLLVKTIRKCNGKDIVAGKEHTTYCKGQNLNIRYESSPKLKNMTW